MRPELARSSTNMERLHRLRVVVTERPSRLFRSLGVATAGLVAAGGYVHFCLYRHGYRTIPKIGVGFLLQVISSVVVGSALLIGPHAVGRISHVTDNLADTLTHVAAASLALGTLAAFALSRTPRGLFNFRERGLEPAPQALIALVAEVGVLVALLAWLLARHIHRPTARLAAAPVV
jgi:hypothetical protein